MPSRLVRATGFSMAMSRAPLATPALIIGMRRPGRVVKQKTSGLSSAARAAASVPVLTSLPIFAAAADRRAASISHNPTTLNFGFALNAAA